MSQAKPALDSAGTRIAADIAAVVDTLAVAPGIAIAARLIGLAVQCNLHTLAPVDKLVAVDFLALVVAGFLALHNPGCSRILRPRRESVVVDSNTRTLRKDQSQRGRIVVSACRPQDSNSEIVQLRQPGESSANTEVSEAQIFNKRRMIIGRMETLL